MVAGYQKSLAKQWVVVVTNPIGGTTMTDEKVTTSNTITNADMNKLVEGITLKTTFKVKRDKDMSDLDRKTIHLSVDFAGVTLNGVFAKTLKPTIIQVQSMVRNNWNDYADGQAVKVKFTAPSETYTDPMLLLFAEASRDGVDPTDQKGLAAYLAKRAAEMAQSK